MNAGNAVGQLVFHAPINQQLGFQVLNQEHGKSRASTIPRLYAGASILGRKCVFRSRGCDPDDAWGPVVMASRCDPRRLTPDMRNSHWGRIFVVNPDRHDLAQMRRAGFRQILTPATVAEIDLRKPLAPHGKWRNAWRRANRGPIDTTHRPFRHSDDWIFKVDKDQQRKKGYRSLPHTICRAWPAQQTHFATAIQNGGAVAAMLFLLHNHVATYQICWTGPMGRSTGAHNRLLAETIDHLTAKGFHRLDLGTVDIANAPGLARFKLRSGGYRVDWAAHGLPRRVYGPSPHHGPVLGVENRQKEQPMTILQIASLLIVLAGAFGAINYLFLKLPPAIGILIVALLASFAVLLVNLAVPSLGVADAVRATVPEIEFSEALLEGVLGLLLFAGALHVKLSVCAVNGWL